MADRFAHAAYLPVAALVDRDAQNVGRGEGDPGRSRFAVLQVDALSEAADVAW
jgi:hypothetical protein